MIGLHLPVGQRMRAIKGHTRPVITAAIIRAATVIDRSTTVVGRGCIVVTITVIVVAAVLGGCNRQTRADDTGEGRSRRGTTATAIIAAAGADIGRVTGPGRRRYALVFWRRAREGHRRLNRRQRYRHDRRHRADAADR